MPLVAVALLAAGCGSDSDDASNSSASATGGGADQSEALGAEFAKQFEDLYTKAQTDGETSVVIWDAASVPNKPLYEAFQKRFPKITVQAQQVGPGDMITKLNAEQAAGKRTADIAATGSTAMIQGAEDGNFESYDPFTADFQKGDPVMSDPDSYFRQYKVGPKGIVYNTSLVKEGEVPKGWKDVLDPKWKGNKIAIRNPTISGGGNELVTDMLYDGRYDYSFFEKLAAQDIKIVGGSNEITSAVTTGQVAMGFPANYDDYLVQKAKGAPIGYVWPTADGVELSELYVGVIKDGPNPSAAHLFESWLFTPEAVKTLNDLGNYTPSKIVPDNAPKGLTPYQQLDAFKAYPITEALKWQKDPIPRLKEIFGQ